MNENICGYDVEIQKKRVKNLTIRIRHDGAITISIPIGVSYAEARLFFQKKIKWVENHLQRVDNLPVDYSYVYLFGEKIEINFFESNKCKVEYDGNDIIFFAPKYDIEKLKQKLIIFLSEQLKIKSREYFTKWQNLTGLKVEGVSFRNTITRWGSCNHATRKINLSIYLANLPEFCLDYVILHEICHIKYANHGSEFKRMLSYYMPKWRDVRNFMRNNANKYRIVLK